MATVIDKLLVQIEANAAQLQAEMAKAGTATKTFGKEAGAIAQKANPIGQRYTQASLAIASAAENMARAGKVGGEGLKQIITQGANMAFLFGPTGALVGAIGVASLAIIEVFRRTEQETRKVVDEVRRLATAAREATGDAAASRLTTIDKDVARLKREIDELEQRKARAGGVLGRTGIQAELNERRGQLTERENDRLLAQQQLQVETRRLQAEELRGLQLLARANQATADELQRKQAIESALRSELRQTNITLERRVQILGLLGKLETNDRTKVAAARAKEEADRFARDFEQAFSDLFAKAKAGQISMAEYDRIVRDLGDSFRDHLKQPTSEQIALFDALVAQSDGVRAGLRDLGAREAARELAELQASLTPSIVDDVALAYEQLKERLDDLQVPPERAQSLLALQRALGDVKVHAEQTDQAISDIERSAISSMDAQLGLLRLLDDTEQELLQLRAVVVAPGEAEATAARIAGLMAEIEKLKQRIKALGGSIEVSLDTDRARDFATSLSDAAGFAFGLSSALLGADDLLSKMLGSTVQVAGGFARIAELAKEAGGAKNLFSTAGGVASALPAIGQIFGGVLSAVGAARQESKDAEERSREQSALLTKSLEALRLRIGDLLGVQSSGRALRGIANAISVSGVDQGFNTRGLSGDEVVDRVHAKRIAFEEALRKAGLSFDDVKRAAEEFGIAGNLGVNAYRALREAILSADLSAFGEGFAGRMRQLEIEARIDPSAFDGIEGLLKRLRVLTDPTDGAPAIARALEGLDLTTSEGRAAAIANLGETLRNLQSLELEDLGGLSLDEFVEEILRAIEAIRAASPAVVDPADRFAAAIEAFGVAVELGSLTAEEKLDRARALFTDLFPELAAGVDTSSADAFRESIRGIIDGFAADGELTAAEQAQIAVLRALLGAFEGATPAAEAFVDALAVLADRFVIFETSARDQLAAFVGAITSDESMAENAGFALLHGILEGIDLATAEGQDELKRRARFIFDLLAEGGVTEEEQVVIDALKRILGLAGEVADEAARAAADAAAEAARQAEVARRRRQGILDGAERRIRLDDVEDPAEQLRIRLDALREAFPALAAAMGDIDPATQEGRDALEAWIRAIAGSPAELEALAAAMGISVDELLDALLGLEEGADSAAAKVLSLADKLAQAFDAAEFDAELEGITDPLERLRRTSASVSNVLPELADLFRQFDLGTAQGRAGAEAALIALGKSTTDAAVRAAVLKLLQQIRAVPADGLGSPGAGGGGVTGGGGGRANVASAASITEVSANRLIDLTLREVVAVEQMVGLLSASLARTLQVPGPIAPPALPSFLGGPTAGGASAGGGGVQIVVQLGPVFAGPVNAGDPGELGRIMQGGLLQLVQQELATELLVALRRAGIARSN